MKSEVFRLLRQSIDASVPAATATCVAGGPIGEMMILTGSGETIGSFNDIAVDREISRQLEDLIGEGGARAVAVDSNRIFLQSYLPPPHLVVVGAVHIAIPLVSIARVMGFDTTVIDARGAFATDERFPHTDVLVEAWPDEGLADINLHPGVAAVILAHDEKFEDPALEALLDSEVGYIGAIGSRKTSQDRLVRLKGRGFTDDQLERIHGPVGLNLGGRSPEEIALSIMAEIVAVRNGVIEARTLEPAKSL